MYCAHEVHTITTDVAAADVAIEAGMRTAISFWQMPPDEAALFEFLRSAVPLVARRNRSQPAAEEIVFLPLSRLQRQNFGTILICRKLDIENVQIDRYKANGLSWRTVNVEASPVITYSREPLNQRDLYLSTLGAALDYVHLRTGERRKKDPEFKKWAKSIVAWTKARCTEICNLNGFDYPATPDVVTALRKREIVLRN